jgi:predicted Zn finger-like uncharacterized protein
MIIKCTNCFAKYNVPEANITSSTKLKCSKCNNIFTVSKQQVDEESGSKKDTAKIIKKDINDSLWSDENLELPDEKKLSIAIIRGARAGYIYKIEKPYILIGRGKVDLIIPDKEISRKHLAIEIRNDKILIRDLGSTNGTFVNKKKISLLEISDQSEFKIGQTTMMLISTPKNKIYYNK